MKLTQIILPQDQIELAEQLTEQGQYQEALELYNDLGMMLMNGAKDYASIINPEDHHNVALWTEYLSANDQMTKIATKVAIIFEERGVYDGAIEYYEEAIGFAPDQSNNEAVLRLLALKEILKIKEDLSKTLELFK